MLGSRAYAETHAAQADSIQAVLVLDNGTGAPVSAARPFTSPTLSSGNSASACDITRTGTPSPTLSAAPGAQGEACLLRLNYVYYGSRVYADEVHHFPPPSVLSLSQGLEEAFHSGNAVVFKTHLNCD